MNAIAKDIQAAINAELKSNLTISNLHGVELSRCLVDPYLDKFENDFGDGNSFELYVVLKEDPDTNKGYQIVYNPERNKFGLALPPENGQPGVLLGYSGTFLDTFKGM